MPLGPLRETCVQPAPKSRLAVFEPLRMKIKSRSRASRLKPVPLGARAAVSGTGFSREEAGLLTILIVPTLRVVTLPRTLRVPHPTRIKAWGGDAERHGMHAHAERGNDQADPTYARGLLVGPASAGKLLILIFIRKKLRRHPSRLGCRLNAGFAQWAEPHGCGESRPPPWMADGGGPTEQDRSEGTLTKEGPNQEQAPLVTWGAFPSNSPKAKKSAVRQTLLILAD